MDLPTLQARRDALLDLRYGGESEIVTRTLDQEERVRFKDDSQLAAAIADCERRIQEMMGGRIKTVRFHTNKGLHEC